MSFTQRIRIVWADESGIGSIAGLYIFIAVLLVGGVAIDYTNAVHTRAQLQAVADSAALAGARHLADGIEAVRMAAIDHADMHGSGLLRDEDIVIGTWKDGIFTADESTPVAVRVMARRTRASDNPLMTQLLFLVGIRSIDVAAGTVAAGGVGSASEIKIHCSGGGFVARGSVTGNSANSYLDGFCLHGETAIHLHNNNHFESGTRVSLPDLANLHEHRNNHGLFDALKLGSHDFARAEGLPDLFTRILDDGISGTALPPQIIGGPVYLNQITQSQSLQRGMLYIVDGNVTLRGPRLFEDVAIYATGNINVRSNVRLNDVLLAAEGNITTASNVNIGSITPDFCSREVYSSYLFSLGDVTFNSNIELRGTLVLSQGNVPFNSNIRTSHGAHVEALGTITYNSANTFRGCGDPLDSEVEFDEEELTAIRLVK